MRNKKGLGTGSAIVIGALVFAIALGLVMSVFSGTQSTTPTTSPVPSSDGNAACIGGVEDVSLTVNGFDMFDKGTSVIQTARIGINGGTLQTGVTTVSGGDKLELLLVNNTGYHNAYIKEIVVPCNKGTLVIDAGSDGYNGLVQNTSTATQRITVFNTDGNSVTDGQSGTVNQTMNDGDTKTMKWRFEGVDKRSTQDMVCVFETDNRTATLDVIVSGLSGLNAKKITGIPTFHSPLSTDSFMRVYELSPVTGATVAEANLQVQTVSGQDLGQNNNRVRGICYTKEYFADVNGEVTYGVEDQNGARRSIALYHHQTFFQN